MPLFSLNADYDRNGVLNASPSEYSSRRQSPGAVITPNLDSDGVSLPASVSCGSPPRLDLSNPNKSGNDNDLIPILVRAETGTVTANFTVKLKISDSDAQMVKLYDSTKHFIQGTSSNSFKEYTLAFTGNDLNLFLEAVTVNGSPLLTSQTSSPVTAPVTTSGQIVLNLEVSDAVTGSVIETDSGFVTLSPLILLGDNAAAEKFYMCEINGSTPGLSDNFASFTDVSEIVRSIRGVPFISVPLSVSNGDSWIQDQFQAGYCQSANSNMKIIFHLPRLRSDARLATAANGLSCISTSYFPSSNLGVFNDFWNRTITVRDVDRGSQSVSFINTVELQMIFDRVWELFYYMWRIVRELCNDRFGSKTEITQCATRFSIPSGYFDDTFDTVLNNLTDLKDNVVRILNSAKDASTDSVRRQRFDNTITDIQALVPALLRDINIRADGAVSVRTPNLSLALEPEDIENLIARLEQIHSSHNYGGNIEVSPPTSSAPLGKIVFGNAADSNGKSIMDPELVSFLSLQNKQPLVPVDTTWLKVGHVDEIVNFVNINSGNSFAIVLASPAKAYQILEEIFLLNTQNLSDDDPMKELYGRPYSIGDHTMAKGPHPVTKLLRGKNWLQSYRENDKRVMPPKIYTDMSRFYGDISTTPRSFYPIPWQDDHYYKSEISVREVLYFSSYANESVIEKMQTVRETLEGEFQDLNYFELPVIFDNYDPQFEQTIAFTPDMINFQNVNNHLLIPRPYGPRMSVEDTIAVLRIVLGSDYSSYLTRQNLRRKNLHRTFHWTVDNFNELSHVITGPYNRPVTVTLDWLAEKFKDGFFPETEDIELIKRRIRQANAGKFMPNGNLRSGWQKIEIPENKVDVFEAYTQILLESIGITVHWTDSWYYHIRSGGIHCGTNVIRTPDLSPAKAWWNVQPTRGSGMGDFNQPDAEKRVV